MMKFEDCRNKLILDPTSKFGIKILEIGEDIVI